MTKILFLPGAGGRSDFWQPVADLIKVDSKLLSWPGLGDEPHSANVSGIDDLVSIVQSHMHEPVNLVAQSMGGLVAVKAALASPLKVRRLVLVVTSAGVPFDGLGAADWRLDYRRAYPNAAQWITTTTTDLSEQLKTLQIPTLLIWGDSDPISPVAVGQRLNELLPQSRLHVIKGAHHDLALSHAGEVAPLISRHFALDAMSCRIPRERLPFTVSTTR